MLTSSSSIFLDEVSPAKCHDEKGRNDRDEHASQSRRLDERYDIGRYEVREGTDANSHLLTRCSLDARQISIQPASHLSCSQGVEECELGL